MSRVSDFYRLEKKIKADLRAEFKRELATKAIDDKIELNDKLGKIKDELLVLRQETARAALKTDIDRLDEAIERESERVRNITSQYERRITDLERHVLEMEQLNVGVRLSQLERVTKLEKLPEDEK